MLARGTISSRITSDSTRSLLCSGNSHGGFLVGAVGCGFLAGAVVGSSGGNISKHAAERTCTHGIDAIPSPTVGGVA
jgi:hypothetical protein